MNKNNKTLLSKICPKWKKILIVPKPLFLEATKILNENKKNMSKKLTDKQILKKAVEKAVESGWTPRIGDVDSSGSPKYEIIFSHDFAQKFWGKEKNTKYVNPKGDEYVYVKYWWQYHLQQMVLKKEPLKYIGKFL